MWWGTLQPPFDGLRRFRINPVLLPRPALPYPHSTCHYNRWIPLARAQDWQPVLDDWTLPERSITGSVKAGRTFGWIGFGGTFPKTIPTQPFGVIPLATGVLSGAFPGRSLSTMPLGFVQTLSWALEATWGPGLLGRLRRAEEPTAQQGITQKRGQWTETGAALSTGTEAGDDDTPGAESNAEDGLGRSEEEPGCTVALPLFLLLHALPRPLPQHQVPPHSNQDLEALLENPESQNCHS